MEQRIAWDDLPRPLKQAIEARTGPITGVRIASAGRNSPLAAIIDASDGKVFAKGLPSSHRRVITQARGAAVAPLVRDITPALLWHFDKAGWNVLGYQYAPGRHADYSPGSPDLDRLVQLMDALSAIKVPDDPGPFKRAEDRWKPYLGDPETAAVFSGPVSTRSDWTPDNVLVSEHHAWLIDWAGRLSPVQRQLPGGLADASGDHARGHYPADTPLYAWLQQRNCLTRPIRRSSRNPRCRWRGGPRLSSRTRRERDQPACR